MPAKTALAEANPRVAIGANDPPAEERLSIEELVDQDPTIVLTDADKRAELFAFVEGEIAKFKPNVDTAKGRKEITSFARRFVSKKTAIDGAGKAMNEAARAQINTVDAARRDVRTKLDAFAEQARAPLTEWESAEKAREEAADVLIAQLKADAVVPMGDTAQAVRERGVKVWNTVVDAEALGDAAERVQAAKDYAVGVLKDALRRLTKEEADAAELAALRAKEAERQREEEERQAKEQEARRQREYAESIMEHIRQCGLGVIGGQTYPYIILIRELEEKIPPEINERLGDLEEPARKLLAETLERVKAAQAEQAKRAQEDTKRAEQERVARIQKEADERAAEKVARAQEEALAAERRRANEAEAAARAERDRIAREEEERRAEQERQAEEQRKREADQEHRTKVKAAAKEAIIALGVPEAKAVKVVQAIVAGDVPHVRLEF